MRTGAVITGWRWRFEETTILPRPGFPVPLGSQVDPTEINSSQSLPESGIGSQALGVRLVTKSKLGAAERGCGCL